MSVEIKQEGVDVVALSEEEPTIELVTSQQAAEGVSCQPTCGPQCSPHNCDPDQPCLPDCSPED